MPTLMEAPPHTNAGECQHEHCTYIGPRDTLGLCPTHPAPTPRDKGRNSILSHLASSYPGLRRNPHTPTTPLLPITLWDYHQATRMLEELTDQELAALVSGRYLIPKRDGWMTRLNDKRPFPSWLCGVARAIARNEYTITRKDCV